MSDQNYMLKTFDLAKKGLGNTWPNPLVGAVIVKDGKIIGEGFHHMYGQVHAEIDALNNCRESAAGATIYVNLEPCCHANKQTPPCAQRLIQEKVKKVVICNLDPNPLVNGKGVALLKEHGIEVEFGLLSDEGEKLNEVFFYTQRNELPFVHLKLATTLDGKIALNNGESQWITSEKSRAYVHELRSLHQGIIAGAQTIRADNPKLNVRLPGYTGKQPWRIVFTKSGKIPERSNIFCDDLKSQTLIYTQTDFKHHLPIDHVIKVHSLTHALKDLYQRKFINLFLEGGANLASSFMKENLINRVTLFMNPSFIGEGKCALGDIGVTQLNSRPKLTQTESIRLGEDFIISGRLK